MLEHRKRCERRLQKHLNLESPRNSPREPYRSADRTLDVCDVNSLWRRCDIVWATWQKYPPRSSLARPQKTSEFHADPQTGASPCLTTEFQNRSRIPPLEFHAPTSY